MVKQDQKIDFVVSWVNGADPMWLAKYSQYSADDVLDEKKARFRDFGIFKYWFRAVENFAPWINHIYLVTDDQVPSWLNLDAPKLTVIDHKQIIPNEFLPVFNSNVIDLNINNIPGLSENFVYFNDDMFVNRPVKPTDFFSKSGLPKDTAGLNAIQPNFDFDYIHVNNMKIINNNFNKKTVMRQQFFKFINPVNLELNIYTLLLFFWPRFTRFFDLHYPYSIKKSNMDNVLSINRDAYLQTMKDRFRSRKDISIWLIRYYALVNGEFSVRSPRVGKIYDLHTSRQKAIHDIQTGKHKLICINDNSKITGPEFDELKSKLNSIFENKFPNKSAFERWAQWPKLIASFCGSFSFCKLIFLT